MMKWEHFCHSTSQMQKLFHFSKGTKADHSNFIVETGHHFHENSFSNCCFFNVRPKLTLWKIALRSLRMRERDCMIRPIAITIAKWHGAYIYRITIHANLNHSVTQLNCLMFCFVNALFRCCQLYNVSSEWRGRGN